MHKRLILIACFIFIGFTTQAQELNNTQLLKLYSLMVDALKHPRPQLAELTRISINQYLYQLDHNWTPIGKDDKIINDDDLFFTWNYHSNIKMSAFLTPTYKIGGNVINPWLEYFTPNATTFNISIGQISQVGKFVSKTKNELFGTDITYHVNGLTYLFSTFPPRSDGFKVSGKPVTLYKITISKTL